MIGDGVGMSSADVILRYSEGSGSFRATRARSFGVPQDDNCSSSRGAVAVLSPVLQWQETDEDERQLDAPEEQKLGPEALGEAVGVQADAELVGAEEG